MIKAVIAISVARIRLLFFNSSAIIAHFGRNPVSGGRPPVDSKINEIIGSAIGILFHISDMEVMDVNECAWKIMNIGAVMRM